MQKKMDVYITIGLLLNSFVIITNQFIIELYDGIAIPLMLVAIICIFYGMYRTNKKMLK